MGARIDQFSEDLRQKLTIADSGLDGLKAKIDSKAVHVEQDVQSHLDRVHKRVEQGRAKVAAAQADIKAWADAKKAATSDKVAEWKAKREQSKLQGHADSAERDAAAASAVAGAPPDEAGERTPGAWAPRRGANAP